MNSKIQTLPPFTRFISTIGQLPASYLVSMTYEEQLLWLCNYLENTIIPTLNNNGEVVEELQALFIELKSFVDNYFDSLDVQEEINNKLDEMASDGTLQEIITQYLNTQALFCYNNVQSMKEATNLIVGSFAKTLGYYQTNDGGEALYIITNISNNNIYQEQLNNGLYATLIYNKEVNVLSIGIKKDDNEFNNNGLILQNFSNINDNIVLYFPLGTYHFYNEIIINNDITLKGFFKGKTASSTSLESSVLYYHPSNSSKTFITQGNTSWQLNVENLTLLCDSGEWVDNGLNDELIPYSQYEYNAILENINGIQYTNRTSIIKNICIQGFSGYGLQIPRMLIFDSYFIKCGNCIELIENDVSIYNCYFTQSKNGIYSNSQKNLMLYNGYFDLMSEYGIKINGYLSGIIDGYFDHINYSGISANAIGSFNGKIKCYRCGMYYSGSSITELKNSDLTTENNNFDKASGICCKGELKNSIIILDTNSLNNSDSQTSSKLSPICGIYLRYNNKSIIHTQHQELIVVRTYNTQNLFANTSEGTTRYALSHISRPTYLIKESYNATGNKAYEVGDLWLNTNNQRLWIATNIENDVTTWKEISFVS